MKQIFTTYSTVTEESLAQGDHAENGWYDSGFRFDAADKPETGEPCEPDKFDKEDGITSVDLAVRYLKDKGACQPSGSHFHPGIWYSTEFQTEDYSSGEQVEYNFHLENFTEDEQQEIFNRITKR
jgi:hypothetical protein